MRRLLRRGPVLALLLAAAGLGLLVSARPWFRATGDQATPEGAVVFSGAEASGGLTQALPAVVLAGVLLTLVLAVRGRRVVAVLLGLAAAGMCLVGVLRSAPSAAAVRARFRQVSLADSYALEGTGWPWAYAVCGVLVLAGALLLWLGCPGWARRTRRYELTGVDTGVDTGDDSGDETGAWRAQDAGLDPTIEPPTGHGSTTGSDPDVRSDDTTDTMGQSSSPSASRRQIGEQ